MFGDLIDLDFASAMPDLDVEALLAALGDVGDFGGELGDFFLDTETGEIVDAATAMAGEVDPTLLGEAGQGMDFSDAGFVDEPPSPLGMSTSDMLRSLEAEHGDPGDGLWRDQMEPFTGLTAQMPDDGFDWMKLLKSAGSGLSGLGKLLGGSGAEGLLGGGAKPLSLPSLGGVGDGGSGGAGLGGSMSASIPSVASPMSAMGVERSLPGGGGGMYGEASTPGLGGTPSSYQRDPITGLPVPTQPNTPPGAPILQLSPFSPLIIPSGGGQIPMAMQPPQRISGLQRLLQEM